MRFYFSRYGIVGYFRLILDIISTRLFFPKARIIRHPFYIRGKKYIKIGKGFTTGVNLRIDAIPNRINKQFCLIIGEDVEVNDYVHIGAIESVIIGNNVLIASKVFITDHNHGNYGGKIKHDNPDIPPRKRGWYSSPVIIEDNVWIGEYVSILPGVIIGKGSIIGAMSLVNKNIPSYSIAVGIPAKVIKQFNFENQKWETI
jgi:acetyltransferase-like isoleucine patch superfamily enzyme